MHIRRIDHTAVYVSDLDRSIAWYEDALGLTTPTRATREAASPAPSSTWVTPSWRC